MDRIVVLSDLSPVSENAFENAKEIAALKPKGQITFDIVTVLEPIVPAYVEFEFGLSLVDRANVTEELRKKARDYLSQLQSKYFSEQSSSVHLLELSGNTTKTILDFCDSIHAKMIVMCTHGRSGVERLMLGSVTEKILRSATCPVLVVPAKKN